MFCKVKRTSVRTIEQVVKYVPTNTEEQILSTSSNLQANEIEKIYSRLPGPTSIFEVKKALMVENKPKSSRARSADAVRAIFHPQEKEQKRIQMDY